MRQHHPDLFTTSDFEDEVVPLDDIQVDDCLNYMERSMTI